ncbi:unnamed protein product [Cuscuta epithymum]|uniref:Uncharacterized protein n=1 Tax=Cuscuta epithymum TaxID=186058 RepID=A0AAV0EER0_9ASTE|nr:unnamed protein product [Cuscuta epithymum]
MDLPLYRNEFAGKHPF